MVLKTTVSFLQSLKKMSLLGFWIAFVFSTTSPVLGETYPITLKDDSGTVVTLAKQPKSIASISTFGADLLKKLGQDAAGLSTLQNRKSVFLGEQVNEAVNLGEIHEPDMERLTELKPDLIVGLRQYAEPFVDEFQEIAPLLSFDLVTMEDSVNAINTLSKALGKSDEARRMNAEFTRKIEDYQNRAPKNVSIVFLWHWADTIYAFFDHHMTSFIMKKLGGDFVAGTSPTPELKRPDADVMSMEKLLVLNPDVIISFTGDDKPIGYHPVWQKLSAVKNKQAFRVSDQYIMPHGPIARDMVMRELAYLMYPDSFPRPTDIPKAAQAKLLTFMQK